MYSDDNKVERVVEGRRKTVSSSYLRKLLQEYWYRFWAWLFGYEWSYPFCNRLTCLLNRDKKCLIEKKQPYWKQVRFNERYCPVKEVS